MLTVGALLLAAFLVPPQRSGYLDVGGYGAVRAGGMHRATMPHAARRRWMHRPADFRRSMARARRRTYPVSGTTYPVSGT